MFAARSYAVRAMDQINGDYGGMLKSDVKYRL
jgi:hypothetical protein